MTPAPPQTARLAQSRTTQLAATLLAVLKKYLAIHSPLLIALDLVRVFAPLSAALLAPILINELSDYLEAPSHLTLLSHHSLTAYAVLYRCTFGLGLVLVTARTTLALRNFTVITLSRLGTPTSETGTPDPTAIPLPPWPYSRESFTVILGEVQDRDGSVVPNEREPKKRPRWVTLPEKALYTGIFATGSIGSGKTSSVAYPILDQLLGFRRPVKIRHADGSITEEEWKFSGLILDEKGDFTEAASQFCRNWGREDDLIRITPGGFWKYNVIFNPNIPAWAAGYQLGTMLRSFNSGQTGSDPFWENKPKDLLTEYLGLLDDAMGYYTISDYLETLIDDDKQNDLQAIAMERYAHDSARLQEIEKRWKSIFKRREGMGLDLRGSLEACAEAGIKLFSFPELRETFCPSHDDYFEPDGQGNLRPRPNVFVGFDQVLDYGKVVGLEMPNEVWYDAARFTKVAMKTQWQDAVLRREGYGSKRKLLFPPRFGPHIGYCPTFCVADECQESATPADGKWKAKGRSKRAVLIELTQSHSSIKDAFGDSKRAAADIYFSNSVTHIYLRQNDMESMGIIEKECGKRQVAKTQLQVSEGTNSSQLSYAQAAIVHDGGFNVSSSKTITVEEKPFVEIEHLKRLPNNVAIVLPSDGEQQLPATVAFMRPLYLFRGNKKYNFPIETPWHKWPSELRAVYDLDIPPELAQWKGWDLGGGALDASMVVSAAEHLGRFVLPAPASRAAAGGGENSPPPPSAQAQGPTPGPPPGAISVSPPRSSDRKQPQGPASVHPDQEPEREDQFNRMLTKGLVSQGVAAEHSDFAKWEERISGPPLDDGDDPDSPSEDDPFRDAPDDDWN